MSNIVIIGTGNVSYHLCNAITKNKKLKLIHLYGRKKNLPENFNQKIPYKNNLIKIKKADIYIICVNDDAILEVSNKLNVNEAIVLHSSGSTDINLLSKHKNHGVFYPLQTFSKNKELLFNNIPIIIEANSNILLHKLKGISSQLSDNVVECNSNQRTLIHISAVFTNNFSNYMNIVAEKILKSQNIDPKILQPLVQETSDKLNYLSANESQTGPAIRNDQITIQKHLNLLKKTKHFEIYNNLTEEIIKLNNEL